MFDWLKRKSTEQKPAVAPRKPVVGKVDKDMQQLTTLYDAVNKMMNAVVLYYEKCDALAQLGDGDSDYPKGGLKPLVEAMRTKYGTMILSQMEMLQPRTEKNDLLYHFGNFDRNGIKSIPAEAEPFIKQMAPILGSLLLADPTTAVDPFMRLSTEATLALDEVKKALAAMKGNSLGY